MKVVPRSCAPARPNASVLPGEDAVRAPLRTDIARFNQVFEELEHKAIEDLVVEGHKAGDIVIERSATMQYIGQSFELVVDAPSGKLGIEDFRRLAADFSNDHRQTYGYQEDASRVQLVSLRVSARAATAKSSYAEIGRQTMREGASEGRSSRNAYFGPEAGWQRARVLRRADLHSGSDPRVGRRSVACSRRPRSRSNRHLSE